MSLLCALPMLATLAAPASALAQEPQESAEVVREVRRGDTLWDLAGECLGDPFRWPEIYRMNTGIVADPDLIYPRESLRLPACGASMPPAAAAGAAAGTQVAPGRTIFYSDARLTGSSIGEESIAPAPLTTAGEFYRAGVLVHEREIVPTGRVAGVESPTVIPVRTEPQIQPNNRIYVQLAVAAEPGDRLHFMREGREVPPYGRIFVSTGIGTVASVEAGTAVVVVDQLFGQMGIGDLALPLAEFSVPEGETLSRVWGPSGRILAFELRSPVRKLHDLAFVDLGRQFGVREGDELEVFIPASRERWGVRPEVRVARLRVVRATDRTATTQVIGMDQPALEVGLPVRVIAKSP